MMILIKVFIKKNYVGIEKYLYFWEIRIRWISCSFEGDKYYNKDLEGFGRWYLSKYLLKYRGCIC